MTDRRCGTCEFNNGFHHSECDHCIDDNNLCHWREAYWVEEHDKKIRAEVIQYITNNYRVCNSNGDCYDYVDLMEEMENKNE